MKFSMSIEVSGPVSGDFRERVYVYDNELDSILSVIHDACEALGSTDAIRFVVTGFDAKPWLVDVETDLATILWSLPDTLNSLRQHRDFSIDFYEQGVERRLDFREKGEDMEIECVSRAHHWDPQPKVMSIGRDELKTMLERLAVDFCSLVEDICPQLTRHPWFQDWKRLALEA